MILIKVRVFTESREEKVVLKNKTKKSGDLYEVHTKASARGGAANREVIDLLAKYFDRGVKMVSGGNRSHKIFEVMRK